MPTVSDTTSRLSPLAEAFFNNLQYALGFLGRVAFNEGVFERAIRNLHASLTALLETREEVRIRVMDRHVCIDEVPLPDSFVLQRIFVRFRCPSVRFERGIDPSGLTRCLRDIESLLIRELAPSLMGSAGKGNDHYRWMSDPS